MGVDFSHQAPTFDARLDHIMPQVAAMGAAVAVADFDRDGWQDLYVTNSAEDSLNRLYRNNGDDTFADVRAEGRPRRRQPARHGRLDGLGLGRLRQRRVGRRAALQVRPARAVPQRRRPLVRRGRPSAPACRRGSTPTAPPGSTTTATACSNLFIAGYWPETVNLWKLETTKIMPESFEYANNGGRKYLLRNRGDGTFEDRTEAMGIRSRRWTLAVTAADLFGTGYPDLFLANDYGVSELFANRGGKRFEDMAAGAGVGVAPKSGMNASVGDVFNDGRLSIYKTNITEPGKLVQGNDLWVPHGGGAGIAGVREPRVEPRRSTSAAGAGARSSAI